MTPEIPIPLQNFLAVVMARDEEAFVRLFTSDAVLIDEGRRYRKSAIREWSARSFIGAHVSLKMLQISTEDRATTLRARVDGEYQSWGITEPFTLDFKFRFRGGRIAALTIVDAGFMPGHKVEKIG